MLAVEIKDGGSTQAGVVDLQSGVLRQLSHARGQTWVRSWSPDGKKMAVAAQRDGVWSLRWIDVQTAKGIVVRAGESTARLRPLSRLVRAG